jgi:PilZ domain-containing protein
MREKRQHFRERLLKPIRVILSPPEGQGSEVISYEAEVVDLSLSGALLNTPVEISLPAQIELHLPSENGSTCVKAEVIRCTKREGEPRYGFALAVRFAGEVPEAAVILARNLLFKYKRIIHSHMN